MLPSIGAQTVLLFANIALVTGRSLSSTVPATHGTRSSDIYLLKKAYPVGNGKLGAMPHGPPGLEKVIINVDSLWSGGPFESEVAVPWSPLLGKSDMMAQSYSGGNPTSPKYEALPSLRANIFANGTGHVDPLLGEGDHFGAYRTLGNFSVAVEEIGDFSDYRRTLDLTTGIHTTEFDSGGATFTTVVYCSFPAKVCVYSISTTGETLPKVKFGFENVLVEANLFNVTCGDQYVKGVGVTQLGPPLGMKYESIARITGRPGCTIPATECSDDGSLSVTVPVGQKTLTIVIGAETNFDQSKGNTESGYSFRGVDPHEYVEQVTNDAAKQGRRRLLEGHLEDYQTLQGSFTFDLPDPNNSAQKETAALIQEYDSDGPGDPFLEALLFDYARHLLITSSREDSLPANLAGRWTEELWPAWSGDYHANINLQMNYWAADQTGLSRTQDALWNYMEKTWVPRGSETAQLLYNASGWVVHNEMNIFGHTAMKNAASWAFYPAAPAWMMQHVWDNFDYTQDVGWFRDQGYPLIKGVAEFWLSQLIEDDFSNDGTLVVNPCNSPEHGPTTFGCAHYQQEIHRVFDTVLSGAEYVQEDDAGFLEDVKFSLKKLDKGLHLTHWGGIKEWKLPDSFGFEEKTTHRHLSHLTGWHPGYSVSSYLGGYTNGTIQSGVRKTLESRGNGNGPDANAAWGKIWRSACWARLNNTDMAHYHLRYAIDVNFADNGFSMYSARNEPFQIDANFGLAGAILSMLVVDLPLAHDAPSQEIRTVVLGPAIPASWAGGSVKGLRLRGGGAVDFTWNDDGVVTAAALTGSRTTVRLVNVEGTVL
ncbi:glycoside hydrolase family 95 protein [Verticillium dahliae]